MHDEGAKRLKLYKGGFLHRRPEVIGLGVLAATIAILALDLRSPVVAWIFVALWGGALGFNLFAKRWALVELRDDGVWFHGRLGGDFHSWADVEHVAIGQDDRGEPRMELHISNDLGPNQLRALPTQLRILRTELSASDVQAHINDFRNRYRGETELTP